MRARLRYSVYSPRAPRRYAGYLTGLILAAIVPVVLLLIGHAATVVSYGAFSALALAVGA